MGLTTAGCDKEWHCVGLMSLQIQNSNSADVLFDSGLKLFNIIANLCSKCNGCNFCPFQGTIIVY